MLYNGLFDPGASSIGLCSKVMPWGVPQDFWVEGVLAWGRPSLAVGVQLCHFLRISLSWVLGSRG